MKAYGLVEKVAGRGGRFEVWRRGEDSNLWPLAYETTELPLLHPALVLCKGCLHKIGVP